MDECHPQCDDPHREDVVGYPVGRLECGDIGQEAPGINVAVRVRARSPIGGGGGPIGPNRAAHVFPLHHSSSPQWLCQRDAPGAAPLRVDPWYCLRGPTHAWIGGSWSGRPDLNRRPPVPQTGALPDCATPRMARSLAEPIDRSREAPVPRGRGSRWDSGRAASCRLTFRGDCRHAPRGGPVASTTRYRAHCCHEHEASRQGLRVRSRRAQQARLGGAIFATCLRGAIEGPQAGRSDPLGTVVVLAA